MAATFWWINHNRTFQQEIEGSYLWFPNRSHKSKARSESEKNIQRLAPGDVVFSFAEGLIGAVGVVLGLAREAVRPAELAAVEHQVVAHCGGASSSAAQDGWLVSVRFRSLERPLRAEERMSELAPVLPRKHSPLLLTGGGNHHVALAAVPPLMAETLSGLLGGELERQVETIVESVGRELADDAAEVAIQRRTDISAAQKSELLKSRYGQGAFRANLERAEHSCRVTGVLDRRHLWARHIKPWSQCDDSEKLDGSNGLLMSPHVAHLFERGYISFSDEGDLLVSHELNAVVLNNWHIPLSRNVGPFRPEQCYFLDYHRREVFQQHRAGRRQKTPRLADSEPLELMAEPAIIQPAQSLSD